MDPLNETETPPQHHVELPFALRVFIVFAASLCAGAGFGLTLWALPTVAPQSIVETTVRDTQHALETILSTEPCTPSGIGFADPCTSDTPHAHEEGVIDEHAGGTVPEEETETPITALGKKILLDDEQSLIIETPIPQTIPKTVPKKPQPTPKTEKTIPTPAKEVPKQQRQPAPVPTAQPAPQPITSSYTLPPPVAQSAPKQVPQCTPNSSYVPAGALPINPNGQAFQLTVDAPSYYTVYGRTPLEVRRQMAQCTTVQGGFDAVTHWWYRYSYNYYQKENGLCAIKDVTLVLHISFLFPYFKDGGENPSLTAEWNRYFASLQTHEYGHRDITISHAESALAAIQAFPDSPCQNVVQSVNAYADAQLNVIQQKNASYDAQTRHGETQGAVFPQ